MPCRPSAVIVQSVLCWVHADMGYGLLCNSLPPFRSSCTATCSAQAPSAFPASRLADQDLARVGSSCRPHPPHSAHGGGVGHSHHERRACRGHAARVGGPTAKQAKPKSASANTYHTCVLVSVRVSQCPRSSLWQCVCVSPCLRVSVSRCLCLCVSVSPCLCVSVSLCLCVSVLCSLLVHCRDSAPVFVQFSLLCSPFSVLCSLFSVLRSLFCSLFSVLCSLFSVLCSLFSVLCSLFSVLCSLFSVFCSLCARPSSLSGCGLAEDEFDKLRRSQVSPDGARRLAAPTRGGGVSSPVLSFKGEFSTPSPTHQAEIAHTTSKVTALLFGCFTALMFGGTQTGWGWKFHTL